MAVSVLLPKFEGTPSRFEIIANGVHTHKSNINNSELYYITIADVPDVYVGFYANNNKTYIIFAVDGRAKDEFADSIDIVYGADTARNTWTNKLNVFTIKATSKGYATFYFDINGIPSSNFTVGTYDGFINSLPALPMSQTQTIPVQYNTLEDTFDITVHQS